MTIRVMVRILEKRFFVLKDYAEFFKKKFY